MLPSSARFDEEHHVTVGTALYAEHYDEIEVRWLSVSSNVDPNAWNRFFYERLLTRLTVHGRIIIER